MANRKTTTKPSGQQRPTVRWEDYYDYRPKSVMAQRRLLRRARLGMDDEGIKLAYSFIIYGAMQSQMREDLAEFAWIKAGAPVRSGKAVRS